MARQDKTLISCLLFFLMTTNGGEVVKWCGTNQLMLLSFKPLTRLPASGEIHCALLWLTHRETDWPSQTAEYTDGWCTLYGENMDNEGCCDNTKTGYWWRNGSDIRRTLLCFENRLNIVCNLNQISKHISTNNNEVKISKSKILFYITINLIFLLVSCHTSYGSV